MYRGCLEILGEELDAMFKALQPESRGGSGYRSRVSIIYRGPGTVRVCIESPTLSSFRAALNTFLRLLSMIIEACSLQ